jgi:hypothetical protein
MKPPKTKYPQPTEDELKAEENDESEYEREQEEKQDRISDNPYNDIEVEL